MAAKRGSLIAVGSGIKSVGHFTLEVQGWIEQSDIVVYCVADPASEVWIQKHSRACFDLYTLYMVMTKNGSRLITIWFR